MPGQPQLGNPLVGADCIGFDVNDITGTPSNLVIQAGSPFQVIPTIQFGGGFAVPILSMPGLNLQTDVYFESIGPGPEGALGSTSTPTAPVPAGLTYSGPATMVTGSIPTPGTYKLTAVSRVMSPAGPPPLPSFPWLAFMEGPVINVFA